MLVLDGLRNQQDHQLSQRDRAAGCVIFFAKSRRLELGDNILRTLYFYLPPLWYNRPENLSNPVKKRKIRAITAFQIIQGHRGRYQSKARVCDFLLVINSNRHPILYRFVVIAAYCSNLGHFAFSSHPSGA